MGHASDIIDEGNASAKVMLRFKGRLGDKTNMTARSKFDMPMQSKKCEFEVHASMEVTAVTNNTITTKVSTLSLKIKRDDINIASKIFENLKRQNGTVTYDTHGNLINQQGSKIPLPSYQFPEEQVGVGSKWEGYEIKEGHKQKISYTVEQIIRNHGNDVAVINEAKTSSLKEKKKLWFNVTKGSIIKSVSDEVRSQSGITWVMRTEVFGD